MLAVVTRPTLSSVLDALRDRRGDLAQCQMLEQRIIQEAVFRHLEIIRETTKGLGENPKHQATDVSWRRKGGNAAGKRTTR